ncbi:tail fiber protein [Sphingomonas sp. AOB5]|uniref:phage tail protein n=1 Tax=Sphingomonas sp. AOB5 TaxID=3034017 RepID=UPI0023F6F448|nr:tail fiber protein [Sphingomonas sp. AOB5]MDF7776264.1 tail fiber protein [Sphingomonas sp. AOB5]
MSNPYLGELRPFAGNFAPRFWALCNGQLLSIAQNNALFALLGTTYGGDGITTFALPDLRGRLALSQGQGPGLTNRTLGEQSGTETVTLTIQTMPAHTHVVVASANEAASPVPTGRVPAAPKNGGKFYLPPNVGTQTDAPIGTASIGTAGGSQPHENLMPILAINYIIALQGIFPSQN